MLVFLLAVGMGFTFFKGPFYSSVGWLVVRPLPGCSWALDVALLYQLCSISCLSIISNTIHENI